MKKVNLLFLALVVLSFAGCRSYDDTDGDWERVAEFAGAGRACAVSFTDPKDGDVFIALGYNDKSSERDKHLRDVWKFSGNGWSQVQGKTVTWQVPETGRDTSVSTGLFPNLGRTGSVAFVIGRKAYVGAGKQFTYRGNDEETYYSDFYVFDLDKEEWEFNETTHEFTRYSIEEDLGISPLDCAFAYGVGFSFGDKGYVGTGELKDRNSKTFFVFDPLAAGTNGKTGRWMNEEAGHEFPGDACYGAVVLDFKDEVYVCLGQGSDLIRKVSIFDGEWRSGTSLNPDLPGAWNEEYDNVRRVFAMAFVSDKDPNRNRPIAYVVGGQGGTVTDNWQYDRLRDRWEKTNKFSSNMASRVGGIGFTYNGYGYITVGGGSYQTAGDNTTWKFYPGIEAEDWND